MQVHFGIELLRAEWRKSVGCIGTFDGVHIGHQQVIRRAVERARKEDLPCVLITFDRHPAAVLAPSKCPKAIAPLQDNLREFERLGVSAAVILQFDALLSRMSAQRFLDEIIVGAVHSGSLVVGHDFAMGNNREGNIEWLKARIPTEVVEPFESGGQRVSSTEIRRAVETGDVGTAGLLLGRPFAVSGLVVQGQRLGRQLGYPTANIARSFDQVMPSDGVYAGFLECSLGSFMAATSIGTRPAVGGGSRTIEAYLLDYPGESLYGQSVRLELCHRLRGEQYFDSLEALKRQIGADVQETRRLLVE
jgi:riboflavin kinase / FMN adenylyltransferase